MLNTNSPNIEPKVKELLLERRHSICLEVSKKRRQSVASSIFIPKDYLHSEKRIKAVSESENKSIPPSRNKKCLALLMNKRGNISRVMLKKKLKRAKLSNKNNNVAKFPTSPISLKHPESYPIVKQTVSSEKIRCVVESLRDTAAKNSEACESHFKMDLYETNEFAKEQKQIHNIKAEQGEEEEKEKLQQFKISSNVYPQVKENNEAESETPVIDSEVQSFDSQINYNSTNKVENFVIMVDSSGAHVEIKYAGHPSPFPNENEKLQNPADTEGDIPAHGASLKETKRQYEHFGYFETNNCTSTSTNKVANSREHVENIYTYIDTDHISRPNSTPSNQEAIIDLSIKEPAAALKSVPVVYRPSNAELIYRSTTIKGINPIIQNTQPTDHGPGTYLIPEKQTRLPSHQKLLDQIRLFAKNPSSSISPACCNNHNSKESSKLIANPHKKRLHSLNKSQVVPFRNRSFTQQDAHLEAPPIIPRNQQWILTPPRMNFLNHNQQQILRNGSVPESTEFFSNSSANSMSHELTYSPIKNTVYPSTEYFQNQLPQRLDDTQQLQQINSQSYLPHNFDQMRQSHQLKQLRQHPFTQQHFNYMEHNQLSYSYPMSNHLDLPRQFYHPLHQCFLSSSNPSRSTSALSTRTAGFEPTEETWQYPSRPNMMPPIQSVEPEQNYLLPTPPAIDRCFPPQQLIPTSFPFPSPNWTNTPYPSVPLKSPSCWNIPPHTYSIQPKLPSEIALLSRLQSSTSAASSMNALSPHTNNSLWLPAHLQKQAPSHFRLNYI